MEFHYQISFSGSSGKVGPKIFSSWPDAVTGQTRLFFKRCTFRDLYQVILREDLSTLWLVLFFNLPIILRTSSTGKPGKASSFSRSPFDREAGTTRLYATIS